MVTKKDLIIAVLVTFCLTAVIFMVIPIRSANSPYDPWLDYNGNGKIDLSDLVSLANAYGTTGNPAKTVNLATYFFNRTYTLGPNPTPESKLDVYVSIEGFRQASINIYWLSYAIDPQSVIDYGVNCTIDMGQFTQGPTGYALFYHYEVPFPILGWTNSYRTTIPVQGQELAFHFHNLNTFNVTELYLRVYMTA